MLDFYGLIDPSNPRWKRAHDLFLDRTDAIELVSFVEALGGYERARYVFAWHGQACVEAYSSIRTEVQHEVQPFVAMWHNQIGVDEGLALIQTVKRNGFRRIELPRPAKMALKALRKQGNTIANIAKATGLSREQVKTGCDVRAEGPPSRLFALALGTKSIS